MEADFQQLYQTYYMQVYSFVMTQAKNRDVSEEIAQKTFFKAMTAGGKYRGESSELTWLCAIAKNLLADEFRRSRRHQAQPTEEIAADGFEHELLDEDAAFRIHQVLHHMEEPYKEVFQLLVFGELPFQKIGTLFAKTENWARVTYHRARLKIQERMEDI